MLNHIVILALNELSVAEMEKIKGLLQKHQNNMKKYLLAWEFRENLNTEYDHGYNYIFKGIYTNFEGIEKCKSDPVHLEHVKFFESRLKDPEKMPIIAFDFETQRGG